ncbi:MAG: replicative DNA helicase [Caldilineaceae bacterium]|nr:replicative DNA helicase [Caldilineaceae bacterium]
MSDYQDTPLKTTPANIEAERAVLGSLLIDPDAVIKIANFVRPSDFFRERHQLLYDAMLTLNEQNEPIDYLTLVNLMEERNQLDDVGGPAYITELINSTPTSMHVDHYAGIVEKTAVLRRLINAAGTIAELAYDEKNEVSEVVDRAEQIIFGVTESRIHRDLTPIRAIMTNVVDRIDFLARNQDTLMGVPTGFTLIDRMLGGFQKSDLIILAGRPGMGKTSFAISVAQNAATRFNARVAVFSLEMSNEQLVQRLLAMETAIDSHRLRLGQVYDEEWPMLLEAANKLADTKIFIDDTPAASVTEIRTKARRLYAEHGLDMILIDYMQLMSGQTGRSENRQQEISYISRSLKGLARELNVPVLALSQLSRAVESRADKRPMLSDLRESGSIEQDADVVLFIYREDYYIEDTDRQNIADVIVAKHRHGSTGTISLFFRKELTQFRDLEIQRTELEY